MNNTLSITIPKPHSGQQKILDNLKRFNVICCGRRFGKTHLGLTRAALALYQKKSVGYFGASYKNLSETWRAAEQLFGPAMINIQKAEHRFELRGGGTFEAWSMDSATSVRGRKYHLALLDEAAHIPDLEQVFNTVIRPTLTDYRGEADFYSTPNGFNYFHELYSRGIDGHPDWSSHHAPTCDNPLIDPDELAAAKDELPSAVYEQEYEAKFLSDGAAVFRNIRACLNAPLDATPEDHDGHHLVAGVDWGQMHDYTVVSVACLTCMAEVRLDRFNRIPWDMQCDRIETTLTKWNVRDTLCELNSIGSPNFEELRARGLSVRPFTMTAQSKPPLIQSLVLAFEKEEVSWLDIPEATRELEAFTATRNKITGRFSFGSPSGMHDDTVIARALANDRLHPGIGVFI